MSVMYTAHVDRAAESRQLREKGVRGRGVHRVLYRVDGGGESTSAEDEVHKNWYMCVYGQTTGTDRDPHLLRTHTWFIDMGSLPPDLSPWHISAYPG